MTTYSITSNNFSVINGTAGETNTLDYTNDSSGVRFDLQFLDQPNPMGFAFTGEWFDGFTNIQNFVGSAAGNNTFQSIGSGNYSFTGQGANNTLDYTYDTDAGVTISLPIDTVYKDVSFKNFGPHGPILPFWATDTFTGMQNFIGSSGGPNVFQSVGTGDYNFTGTGNNNTLNYSADTDGVTITMSSHAVSKDFYDIPIPTPFGPISVPLPYIDTFSNIQTLAGLVGTNDTVVFSGASNQYNVTTNPDGSITVSDSVAGRNGSVTLDQIENLQFTNTTVTESYLGGSFTNSGAAVNSIYEAVLQRAAQPNEISNVEATATAHGDAAAISAIVTSPEAQYNVDPVVQVIYLATGNLPTAAQLSGWVPFVEGNGLLTGQAQANPLMDQMAHSFVASDAFGATYNNGTDVNPDATITDSIAAAIIKAATGVAATQAQITAYGSHSGLTTDQVFVDFALGDQYTTSSQPMVQHYLTALADYAAGTQFAGASTSVMGTVPLSSLIHA